MRDVTGKENKIIIIEMEIKNERRAINHKKLFKILTDINLNLKKVSEKNLKNIAICADEEFFLPNRSSSFFWAPSTFLCRRMNSKPLKIT